MKHSGCRHQAAKRLFHTEGTLSVGQSAGWHLLHCSAPEFLSRNRLDEGTLAEVEPLPSLHPAPPQRPQRLL